MSEKSKRKNDENPINSVEACPICGHHHFDEIELGQDNRYYSLTASTSIFPKRYHIRRWRCSNCAYILAFTTDNKK